MHRILTKYFQKLGIVEKQILFHLDGATSHPLREMFHESKMKFFWKLIIKEEWKKVKDLVFVVIKCLIDFIEAIFPVL